MGIVGRCGVKISIHKLHAVIRGKSIFFPVKYSGCNKMNPLITHRSLKSWDTDIMRLQILHRLRPWHHHQTVLLGQLNSNLAKSFPVSHRSERTALESPRQGQISTSIPELVPRSQQQCYGNECRHLWSCRQHHFRAQP